MDTMGDSLFEWHGIVLERIDQVMDVVDVMVDYKGTKLETRGAVSCRTRIVFLFADSVLFPFIF